MDSTFFSFVRRSAWLTVLVAWGAVAPLAALGADATERSAHVEANRVLDRNPNRVKGRQALADGLPDVAARFFRECLAAAGKSEPQRTDATLLLIQALLRHGDPAAAAQVLAAYDQESQAFLPGQPRAAAEWQDKLAYWRALVHLELAQWAVARTQLEQLAARELDDSLLALVLEALGDCCVRQGDWAAATRAFLRHQEEFSRSPRRLLIARNLVFCRIGAGDLTTAAAELAALAKRSGDAPLVAEFPALVLRLASQDLAGAWSLYQTLSVQPAAREDRCFWLVSRQLADALIRDHRLADAQAVLSRALPAAPTATDRRQTWLLAADLLLRQGNRGAAIAELARFLKEFPTAPERVSAQLRLAATLRENGQLPEAAERYGEVAALTELPRETRFAAALLQADCLLDAKLYAAAATRFFAAADLAPTPEKRAETLFRAAAAAADLGNPGQAADWYAAARAAAPEAGTAAKAQFNEALCRVRQGRPAEAAELFDLFLKANPEHPLTPQAVLERGIALREAGLFDQAVAAFDSLVASRPKNELAPQALLESHLASVAAGAVPAALATLERVRQLYPESPQACQALYRQVYLRFRDGQAAAAAALGNQFLEQYSHSPLGADVLVWLGDHEASQNRPAEAEKRYLDLALRFPTSPLAPQALIDTARSAFLRRDVERTARMVALLDEKYASSLTPAQLAQTRLLDGDLLAEQGNYATALLRFRAAAAAAPGTEFALQALGRQGDMLAVVAGEPGSEPLAEATALYTALLENPACPPPLADLTRYRLAKVLERRKLVDEALKQYLELFYQFDLERAAGTVRDWTWFVRAGNDAASLILLTGRPNGAEIAARIYERLAASGAPGAADAQAKAKELRASHRLDR